MPGISPSKRELLRRLSALSTEQILSFLDPETIYDISRRYFESTANIPNDDRASLASEHGTSAAGSSERAKRPLNAFMAYRSYYLKLFPEIQQKTASGFLTTLWHNDPFRNRWALIAKVYSFVRDEVGKGRVSLSGFLELCCPLMNITEPAAYLNALGWSVSLDSEGNQKLSQDESASSIDLAFARSDGSPTNEMELLTALVNAGYLPERANGLVRSMGTQNSPLITADAPRIDIPVPYTTQKLELLNALRLNPFEATRELLQDQYTDEIIGTEGVRCHNVQDLRAVQFQMLPPYYEARHWYSYSDGRVTQNDQRVLGAELIEEHEPINIDDPFDVDAALGYTESEQARTDHSLQLPPHDPTQNFHFGW